MIIKMITITGFSTTHVLSELAKILDLFMGVGRILQICANSSDIYQILLSLYNSVQ